MDGWVLGDWAGALPLGWSRSWAMELRQTWSAVWRKPQRLGGSRSMWWTLM